jgi:hypothetical protein
MAPFLSRTESTQQTSRGAAVCQKRQRRCAVALRIKEEALQEWARAETLEEVRRAWSRCGGRITFHRRGSAWFRVLALRRWEKASSARARS